MNFRHYRAVISLPALIVALAGRGALRAQSDTPQWPPPLPAGPYALGYDPENGRVAIDEPIPGFVGPAGDGVAPYGSQNLQQYVNPAFVEWASFVANYAPARPDLIEPYYIDPSAALGSASGNVFDVVSLGDLSALDIAEGLAPGSLTVGFETPIGDGPGPDFAVFGNAFNLRGRTLQAFSKLAFVEVSSDGVNFARFPSVDTNPKPAQNTWPYMVANPTLIYNLFGKAVNGYGASWGVPFDLAELRQHPLVAAGLLDLNNVRFVRLVAVVGNGQQSIDAYGHPIYDPWPTTGSPGPEVQAIGVLNTATAPDSANATASTSGMGAGGPGAPITAAGAKINRSAANAGRFIPTMFSASDPGSASTLVGDTGFSSADSTSPTLADETASHDTLMDISPNLVTGSSNESGVATGKIKSFSDSVPSAGSAIEQGQKNMAGSLAETVSPAVKIAAMRSLAATLPAKSPWASSSSLLSELALVGLALLVGFAWWKWSVR